MPNPVAANDSTPISGSLQTSRISYGVDLIGKNYGQNYNGTKWYSDIPNDGTYYTIVSDNYTANYYISRSLAGGAYVEGGQPAVDEFSAPVFWTTQGTSSADIIAVVNGLPDRKGQTAFTTGEQALNWIASSGNYFAIGPDYFKQTNADNLGLYLDANQIISYPTTESTWYDISGNSKDGDFRNGPTWNPEGWVTFDGTNDYIQGPIPNQNTSEATLELIYRTTADEAFPGENRLFSIGVAGNIVGGSQTTSPGISLRLRDDRIAFAARKGDNSGYWDVYSGATVIDGRWKHVIGTFDTSSLKKYENGRLTQQTSTGQTYLTASDGYNIGGPVYYVDGDIARARFYNKRLTEAEVLQNYYGGPIVTDGLVFHVDANKLISYSTVTGPEWFDMSDTMQSTQLLNGVTWSPENGGVFLFDGVDDIGVNSDPLFEIPESVTINAWIKESSSGATVGNYMAKANNNGYRMRRNGGASGDPLWIYSSGNSISGGNIYNDVWHMVTGVFSDTGLRAYIDGELVASNSTPYTPANLSSNDMFLGAYSPGSELFGGEMAMAQTYNRALTTEEIQQNYNATK